MDCCEKYIGKKMKRKRYKNILYLFCAFGKIVLFALLPSMYLHPNEEKQWWNEIKTKANCSHLIAYPKNLIPISAPIPFDISLFCWVVFPFKFLIFCGIGIFEYFQFVIWRTIHTANGGNNSSNNNSNSSDDDNNNNNGNEVVEKTGTEWFDNDNDNMI